MVVGILSGLCVALAVMCWPVRRTAAERLKAVVEPPEVQAPAAENPAGRIALVAGPVLVLVVLVVGGVAGVVLGVILAGLVVVHLRRKEAPQERRRRELVRADLPFAADLMAECLRAGQPLVGAVEIVARVVDGPLGERLRWAGGQMRLGADPVEVWRGLAAEDALALLARAIARAVESGAPVADVLTRVAEDARQAGRAASSAAARRVGVRAVAPLGLCFLPAFCFLGIVPVVAGLAAQVLS